MFVWISLIPERPLNDAPRLRFFKIVSALSSAWWAVRI